MDEIVNGVEQHTVCYSYVYGSGWEHGDGVVRTTSADPWKCARMVLARVGGGHGGKWGIVGVRVHRVDGERVDVLYLPGRE